MTTPQTIIFSVTFLAISIMANVFLFIDQTKLEKSFARQTLEISELKQELKQSSDFKRDQLAKLGQMGGQQNEFAIFIKELQQELAFLTEQYKLSTVTADQTKQQLNSAQGKIKELAKQNKAQSQQLAEAEITIRNQLRALKSAQTESGSLSNFSDVLSALTSIQTPEFKDITIAQSVNGDVILNIPLELIFAKNLEFTEQAELILDPISLQLLTLPGAEISVIGHSDSRPITSELAKNYPTNWELSAVRASKVVSYFNKKGISETQLVAAGKSSNQPVRDENNSEAWAINRRIEIRIH